MDIDGEGGRVRVVDVVDQDAGVADRLAVDVRQVAAQRVVGLGGGLDERVRGGLVSLGRADQLVVVLVSELAVGPPVGVVRRGGQGEFDDVRHAVTAF